LTDSNLTQNISLISMSRDMFLIVTAPVLLGMLFRKFASGMALKFEPIAKKVSTVLLHLFCWAQL